MLRKSLALVVLGFSAIAATPAAACCGCQTGCGDSLTVYPYHHAVHPYQRYVHRAPLQPYYVVNQGPVYSGPNIMTLPRYVDDAVAPAAYPYVGGYYPRSYRWSHGVLYPSLWRRHHHHVGCC